MDKPTSKQHNSSWRIYRLRGTPAQLIGLVHDQPDEQAAIKVAFEQFKTPENQLIARRLD
jgi:hypothetical protein